MRLIDADAIQYKIENCTEVPIEECNRRFKETFGCLKCIVDHAPTMPVVHGYWIPVEDDVLFRCSRCDSEISTSWDYDQADMWNYCPCCGAKMDEVTDDA